MEMKFLEGGTIRAYQSGKQRVLEVLAAPFGSPTRKDKLGQYLSKNTDFMLEVGDRRPALYFHGYSPMRRAIDKPKAIGIAEVSKIDEKGLWMRATIDDSELSNRTWEAALTGNARASTGSVNYLARDNKATGEVEVWPIAEVSVWDAGDNRVPVSDDAVVLPLRALFDQCEIQLPESFEAGEDKNAVVDPKSKEGDINMSEIDKAVQEALEARDAADAAKAVEKEAMRAELEKEIEASPKYRSTFNVNTITGDKGKTAEEQETFAFVRGLVEDGKMVFSGGMPRNAYRVLEESEALELGPMVPTDLANKIHTIRGKYSLVRKSGMTVYQTDKLTFAIPTETTATAVLPTIAEEGAYVANEAAFASKSVAMLKKGSLIAVTEEALEDQDLFQQWLAVACGKALALAENATLEALLVAIDGVEVATRGTILDQEMLDCYFGLAQENRDEAVWIMNDTTLAYVRAMLVATPRAYGEFGFVNGSMGELGETLMNKRVFTNANWDAVGVATDDTKIIDFVNLDQCIAWVERRGLSIFVDPYSARASAGVINYLPSARFAGVTVDSSALSGIDETAT